MPRKGNPGDIKTGPGKPVPEEGGDLVLIGPGTPPSPNVGEVGYIPPGSDLAHARQGIPPDMKTGSGGGDLELQAHINAVRGAHPASAITYDQYPAVIQSRNVEGALDEMQGAIPAEPPKLGQFNPRLNSVSATLLGTSAMYTGIPDWGWLKLDDSSIKNRDTDFWNPTSQVDLPNNTAAAGEVYPYFLVPPSPAIDLPFPFIYPGSDPASDGKFNTGIDQNELAPYAIGAGPGKAHAGGFTRTFSGVDHIQHTLRLMQNLEPSPTYRTWGVASVSGTIYPSDRGVLALLRFPPNSADDPIVDFLNLPILDRCIAALLLGQGLEDGTGSIGSSIGDMCLSDAGGSIGAGFSVDGDPGGIFSIGFDVGGNYDPFAFPGRASGQFDLREIHMGKNIWGQDLPAPWNGDKRRVKGSNVPAPGQVRLGSDPAAGIAPSSYGIPILGAMVDSYFDPAFPLGPYPFDGYIPLPPGPLATTYTAIGNSIIPQFTGFPPTPIPGSPPNWGIETNFFKYRLPYLDDYTYPTGLKYTPRGPDPIRSSETQRYFLAAFPFGETQGTNPWKWQDQPLGFGNAPLTWDDVLGITDLPQAGNYPNFKQDYWNWQLARFRHSFLLKPANTPLPPVGVAPVPYPVFEVGSYWLVHFRTEDAFERFVRDGDVTAATEVYGAHMVDMPPQETGNLVNEETGTYPAVLPPNGPAPDMGYAAFPYHQLRSNVQLSDRSLHVTLRNPPFAPADFPTLEWDWNINPVLFGAVDFASTWISGVGYMMPRTWFSLGGSPFDCFQINTIDVDLAPVAVPDRGPWKGSYRTDDAQLLGFPPAAPALLSSPDPALLGLAAFSYGLDSNGDATFMQPPGWEFLNPLGDRRQRVEFPHTFFENGTGQYDDSNAPLSGDHLVIGVSGGEVLQPTGDPLDPAFTYGHKPRIFIRRPLAHDEWQTSVQPSYIPVVGHGVELETIVASRSKVLFHSTGFYFDVTGIYPNNGFHGRFGNISLPGIATPIPTWPNFYDTEKDTYERFLDETYRYIWSFPSMPGNYQTALVGPGLPVPTPGITVPVRAGIFPNEENNTPFNPIATTWNPPVGPAPLCWQDSSWFQTGSFWLPLDALAISEELQVAGWPRRNPAILDWVTAPFPSTGLLKWPNLDYTTYRPSLADEGIFQPQPDYSTLYPAVGTRSYVRCFDVAFSWSEGDAPGASAFDRAHPYDGSAKDRDQVLRIDGLQFSDFSFPHEFAVSGGPGVPGGSKIAILVKIPGVTNWMDIAVSNGAGPPKNDPALDGAGCLQSYGNRIDPLTKLVYCRVGIETSGTPFSLFNGQEHIVGIEHQFEVPLLVKVMMAPMAEFDHDLQQDITAGGPPAAAPGASPTNIRGLVGIRVVHLNDQTIM